MTIPWSSITAGVTAIFSAVAGVGAWMAARRANTTADAVARIESDRWHADLMPQFNISIEGYFEGDRTTLSVRLVGPLPLRRLDEIRVRVVASDDMSRIVRLAGGPSQEQVDAQVWGPLRFVPSVDGADGNGQAVAPFALSVGTGRPFALERTRPPLWQQGDDRQDRWRDQWTNTPLRLILTCKKEGFEPWVVPYEVDAPGRPRIRSL